MDGLYIIPKCLAGTIPKSSDTRTKTGREHDIILQLHESHTLK